MGCLSCNVFVRCGGGVGGVQGHSVNLSVSHLGPAGVCVCVCTMVGGRFELLSNELFQVDENDTPQLLFCTGLIL